MRWRMRSCQDNRQGNSQLCDGCASISSTGLCRDPKVWRPHLDLQQGGLDGCQHLHH